MFLDGKHAEVVTVDGQVAHEFEVRYSSLRQDCVQTLFNLYFVLAKPHSISLLPLL